MHKCRACDHKFKRPADARVNEKGAWFHCPRCKTTILIKHRLGLSGFQKECLAVLRGEAMGSTSVRAFLNKNGYIIGSLKVTDKGVEFLKWLTAKEGEK